MIGRHRRLGMAGGGWRLVGGQGGLRALWVGGEEVEEEEEEVVEVEVVLVVRPGRDTRRLSCDALFCFYLGWLSTRFGSGG